MEFFIYSKENVKEQPGNEHFFVTQIAQRNHYICIHDYIHYYRHHSIHFHHDYGK